MATTAVTTRKHTRPEDDFTSDPRAWFDLFSDSLNDAIPVANTAARTAMLAALAARTPAITPAATKPILFEQQDLPAAYRYLYTDDGLNFISLSGAFVWPDAAARAAATTMAAGDKGYQLDTGITYRHDGAAWKAWESPWLAYTATLTNFTVSAQVSRYRYFGGEIEVDWKFTIATMANSPTATLPVNAAALKHPNMVYTGNGSLNDTSAGTPFGCAFHAAGTAVDKVTMAPSLGAATISAFTSSSPFAWAAGDIIQGRFVMTPA